MYEHELVGWYGDAPPLGLDHEEFAYAGKFDGNEGKFVTRDNGAVVAALSFSPDHAHENGVRVRYFAVRKGRRGKGIGTSLLRHASDRLLEERGYERVRISVNNPFAYESAQAAGFGWTGETSGIAELVMERPAPDDDRYEEGLRVFAERDLSEEKESFVRERLRE